MGNTADFLGMMKTQIVRSELAYKAYINSGKIFLYAKVLKDINEALRCLLLENTHLLPSEHIANSLILIHHIDVWSAIWEESYLLEKPSLTTVFSFENTVNFPRKEVNMLLNYYEKISF
jgi:hypothetical protein